MGLNKKMHTCEVCGFTVISDDSIKIECPNQNCRKNKEIKNENLLLPKDDIRVNGC